MGKTSKTLALFLTLIISMSCLPMLMVKPANAQTAIPTIVWSKTYSPNLGLSLAQTSDGGYIIAGINRSGFHDSLSYSTTVIKTNALGETEWEKQFGDKFSGLLFLFPLIQMSIIQTSDSGYILSTPSSTIKELIKLDSQGNIEWSTQVSGGKVIEVNDGYVVSGFSMDSYGNTFSNITKIDSKGQILWVRNFDEGFFVNGVQGDVAFRGLSKTLDGKYAVAGNWGFSYWFGLMDTDGNLLVNKTYPQDGHWNGFLGISNTNDGGYILCGQNGKANAVLYKVDGQGNLEWNNTYSPSVFNSIVQTSDNEYVVGTAFGFLVKTDANGNKELIANYSSGIFGVTTTSDRGFAVTGVLDDSLWLAKFSLERSSSATPISPSPTVPELPFIFVTIVLLVLTLAISVFKRKAH